jgi:hypothetical protein
MQHHHVVTGADSEGAVGNVVIGIVDGGGAQLHRLGGEVHRAAEQELELASQVHMGVNRGAWVEAKAACLGAAVGPAEQHLALEGDALGAAGFPRKFCGINRILCQHRISPALRQYSYSYGVA